jgi:DNA-binding response OmpR family regulator
VVRILVVDNERDLVWVLQQSLASDGYEVLVAYDGLEALALAQRSRPDLVILDIVMPGLDGREVCRRLRQDPALATVPVIFLSVRASPEEQVAAFDGGGDDYVAKPFDLAELKARIRNLLRRSGRTDEQAILGARQGSMLVAGALSLDLKSREAIVQGRSVELTPTEFDLLRYLLSHANQVCSRETLLHEVWGYDATAISPGLVRWHIKKLRAKIESDPAHPLYIHTRPRHGYVLKVGI